MAFLRVDTSPLLPPLRSELTAMLTGLSADEWMRATACPGWPVHAVASHLLGVELGNVSVRRDHWALGPGKGEDPDAWLNAFNQQWVEAARRISPPLLIECLDAAGRRFEEHVAALDLDIPGGPVGWATGSDAAPVWLDVAREYMERFVHQQQIRDATGRPGLGADFTGPVLVAAAHALPMALRDLQRPAGTTVTFTAAGKGGGTWHVTRTVAGWELGAGLPAQPPSCELRTTVDGRSSSTPVTRPHHRRRGAETRNWPRRSAGQRRSWADHIREDCPVGGRLDLVPDAAHPALGSRPGTGPREGWRRRVTHGHG